MSTTPPVMSATRPKCTSLQSVPSKLITDTETLELTYQNNVD